MSLPIKQQVYDMHQETADFLVQMEVKELPSVPPEWELVPIEQDRLSEWVKKNS